MNQKIKNKNDVPMILAPAGSKASFLSAIAAKADGIYCGLKLFSARMEADNFGINELGTLALLAKENNVKVYVTFNSLLKSNDIDKAKRVLDKLIKSVNPHALIIQDLSVIQIVKNLGFTGQLHLSTLANLSFPLGLIEANRLGISHVVIPRELNIDEIKTMAKACPDGLKLEMFVHGALCYAVSGRCYWSSFLGGKSGLRGRCVQPCRRIYEHKGQKKRFFSCMDFSIDVLTKVIKDIPQITTWKIEGRKKGPHYVFYLIQAYKILRDHREDPSMKKIALQYLEQSLGRPTTHYNFLPQRPQLPIQTEVQTSSGLFIGKVKGGKKAPSFSPRQSLMAGDLLRIGYEDEPGHTIVHIGRSVPKHGSFNINSSVKKIVQGSCVFLLDRREKELGQIITDLEHDMEKLEPVKVIGSSFLVKNKETTIKKKSNYNKKKESFDVTVVRNSNGVKNSRVNQGYGQTGLWLSNNSLKGLSKGMFSRCWWWLSPVIWADNEDNVRQMINHVISKGGRNFVLNAPWQISFFMEKKWQNIKFNLWAGPFCNQANNVSIEVLASQGFSGVIVSPELTKDEYINLGKQSVLPLGIVLYGNWPFCISRIISENMNTFQEFTSPKGEKGWIIQHGTQYWIYPNWFFDITAKKEILQKAGYTMMVYLHEPVNKKIKFKKRPGTWNWNLTLL